MILRILMWLLAAIVIIYIGYWLLTGGLSRAIATVHGIDNPFDLLTSSTTGSFIRLPWQPSNLYTGNDISDALYEPSNNSENPRQKLDTLQNRYQELEAQVKDAKTFGNPSPFRGMVTFGTNAAQEINPTEEYISLQTAYANTSPISLAGWSLQSAVSGIRIALPPAAPMFIAGVLNSVTGVSLAPGDSEIVVSGPSPVGVSFRENICSGYLGELQHFTPDMDRACPLAGDSISLTPENIQTYGDSCFDYLKTIPQCHFPGRDAPPTVSPECKSLALNTFSYNGCVYAHRNEQEFTKNSVRIYLASGVELWRNGHDIIRLLDDQSRTVDVLTY